MTFKPSVARRTTDRTAHARLDAKARIYRTAHRGVSSALGLTWLDVNPHGSARRARRYLFILVSDHTTTRYYASKARSV